MKKLNAYAILASILMLVATLTSCEKFSIDQPNSDSRDANANVIIHVQTIQDISFSLLSRSASSSPTLGEVCSRLTLAIFDGEDKIESINQEAGDEHFGTAQVHLDEGEYELVAIAHSGAGNCSISTPTKVKFASNKLTDTFYYYGTLTVSPEGAETEIELKRAVGGLNVQIADKSLPTDIKRIKFYYTGGSSTLDATTGYGCVNSRQTEIFNIEEGQRDFTVYTFPHKEEKNVKMTISLLDDRDNAIRTYQKSDLHMKRNQMLKTSLSLSGGTVGGTGSEGGVIITFNPEWDEEEVVEFN